MSCAGTGASAIKYAGMEYDSETKFYKTLFRYYNPRLGLWMTPDPAGLAAANPRVPQSLNRYAYVGNAPANFFDPLGLIWVLFEQQFCVDSGAGDHRETESNWVWLDDGNGGTITVGGGGGGDGVNCAISVSCRGVQGHKGCQHCTVTTQNGPVYTAYDAGPSGSIYWSKLIVGSGAGSPPGPDAIFTQSITCSPKWFPTVGCVDLAARAINAGDIPYSFSMMNSNTGAKMMVQTCGMDAPIPDAGTVGWFLP